MTPVWDLPTRLFHWLLAGLIAFSWWSHEDHLDWHRLSGFAIASLLVFRLWWGIAGSSTARFGSFVKGPKGIAAYLKGGEAGTPGHNPLGALSVLAMLVALVVQVTLGLFATDQDMIESGPLAKYVDYDTSQLAAQAHGVVFNILLGLIVLHFVAIGWYVSRRKNLIGPMITGRAALPDNVGGNTAAPVWRLLVGLVLAGATFALLYWLEQKNAF